MADPVVPQQIWDPNLKRFINVDTHDDAAGHDLESTQRLQSALGLGSHEVNHQAQNDEPPPNTKGMGLADAARALSEWRQRKLAKQPILARPSPTQNAPQATPTVAPNPIAGLIQQMLGMNQQNG